MDRSDPHSLLYLPACISLDEKTRHVLTGYGLVVVLPILYVISAHNFDLAKVCILLPLLNGEEYTSRKTLGNDPTLKKSTFFKSFFS